MGSPVSSVRPLTAANEATDTSIVVVLSELAARVQRGRTTDAVLETAGAGILRLGMRLAAFQIVEGDVLLRFVATSPCRQATIEHHLGRPLRGLRASLAGWDLVRTVVEARATLYREDLALFDDFIARATGFDATPLGRTPETAGIQNGVLAPLWVREEPWGLLAVASPALTPRDAAAVSLFATQVASSLELAEYIEALENANQRLAAVNSDLAETQEQLAKRERLAALGELAAVVAHEVRNPLGVLFNSISSLRRLLPKTAAQLPEPEDVQVLLTIASEEADRLNQMVSDLLDFARPTVPVIEKVSLREVIEDAVEAVLSAPGARNLGVEIEVAEDLPHVAMDSRCVRQVLLNVLVNGFQAMRECGNINVRAVPDRDGKHSYARVEVSDSGPGIPGDLQARIFEPFFTTKASGTGLGLAIVKRIMVAHGGNVSVDSAPGRTTVSLLLPIEPTEDAPPCAGVAGR